MKRFTAIFLLLFMLMSAIQPVFAMHFCGKRLHSFYLLQNNKSIPSCCEEKDRPDNNSLSHGQLPKDNTASHYFLDLTYASCCDTQLLKPGTDDYQTKTEQPVSRISSISHVGAAALLFPLFKLSDIDTTSRSFFQNFPPKGFFLMDVRLLTYICIYRI